jgi:hypothetical protein
MNLLPLPKQYESQIYCVTDGDKRWIGITRNWFRAYSQFKKTGKVQVSDEATFMVLDMVPSHLAQEVAERWCGDLRARMMPARKGIPIIKYDPTTGGELEYDNIVKACADLEISIKTLRTAIKEQKLIGGYRFRFKK